MPRDLSLGNGTLLVNFDEKYQLRDLYWPFVGQENHTSGHPNRFGVWVDGAFAWVADDEWQRSLKYARDSLLAEVTLRHDGLGLQLDCRDAVDFHENLFLREVAVHNLTDREREVRLFFAQDFHVYGLDVGDSAYYEPERRAIFHYKGQRWFLVNTAREWTEGRREGVDQWAVGKAEFDGLDGAWRDAEDGLLSGNTVAQGRVDSCVAMHLALPARGQATGWYWIAVGEDFHEVTRINRAVRTKGPRTFLNRTQQYWRLWLQKEAACALPGPLPATEQYHRSLLILRSHCDNGGAIIAATDFDITRASHDTYSYMWPRDGALAADALVEAGYQEVPRQFFTFCHRIITPEGYFLHKYTPDGSLASSWMGWYYQGRKVLPVQEDETALVLWTLWRHFQRYRDVEFIKPLFRGLIIRAANWLASYRDETTGLPLPSWDLWEERWGIFAWTIGAVWGGLQAAANFADAFGEQEPAALYREAAQALRAGADTHLWSAKDGHFLRMLLPQDDALQEDATLDASLAGLWLFGMYPADDPRIAATMTAVRQRLWVKTEVGGVARYESDQYQKISDDVENVPGNPWFICTLWLARWLAETAKTPDDLLSAQHLLEWADRRALPSGALAEQLDPYTGSPLSVNPLTWSHAEYITTTLALQRAKTRCQVSGVGCSS